MIRAHRLQTRETELKAQGFRVMRKEIRHSIVATASKIFAAYSQVGPRPKQVVTLRCAVSRKRLNCRSDPSQLCRLFMVGAEVLRHATD